MKSHLQYMNIGLSVGSGISIAMLLIFSVTHLIAQQLKTFSSGQVLSATDINANFETLRTETALKPPVGSIIAWHKTLTGVPSLPAGWMECDGSVVSDSNSPLNGQTLPDLNGQRRFLRGDAASGTLEADMFRSHTHAAPNGGRFHYLYGSGSVGGGGGSGIEGYTPNTLATGGSETRPVNMSVIWIIRIK